MHHHPGSLQLSKVLSHTYHPPERKKKGGGKFFTSERSAKDRRGRKCLRWSSQTKSRRKPRTGETPHYRKTYRWTIEMVSRRTRPCIPFRFPQLCKLKDSHGRRYIMITLDEAAAPRKLRRMSLQQYCVPVHCKEVACWGGGGSGRHHEDEGVGGGQQR